jgi:hypothetical protein
MRSRYRELGLKLVSLEENFSCHPKKPPMVEEKRYVGAEDPIKLLLVEALVKQRNETLENFSQNLQQLSTIESTYSSRSLFGDTSPFKVQVNLDIYVF